MTDSIRIHARPHLLGDEVHEIILEVFGHSRDESNSDRRRQQHTYATQELEAGVLAVTRGVRIDDVPEDEWIEQRKDLVYRRQHQRGYAQFPVLLQITIQDSHRPLFQFY